MIDIKPAEIKILKGTRTGIPPPERHYLTKSWNCLAVCSKCPAVDLKAFLNFLRHFQAAEE